MLRIKPGTPGRRLHLPGDLIEGTIEAVMSGTVSDITISLIGTLSFETYSGGYAQNSHVIKEFRFIDEKFPISTEATHVSAGDQWPFQLRLPEEVDWYKVDRQWREPLGVDDISLISTSLPPSAGGVQLHELAHIAYRLELKERSIGPARDGNRTSCRITVCPTRRTHRPDPQLKVHQARFQVQSHHLAPQKEEPSKFRSFLSGAGKTSAAYAFSVYFRVPQVCVIGEQFELQAELRSDGLLSTGSPAPPVILEQLNISLKSHTKLDIGLDFRPKGRGMDYNAHAYNFDLLAGDCCIPNPIELQRSKQESIRESPSRVMLGERLVPSFQTLGLGQSYSIEISGEVSVKGEKMDFSLRKQMIKICPVWYQQQQRLDLVVDARGSDQPLDVPPPAYTEATADLMLVDVPMSLAGAGHP